MSVFNFAIWGSQRFCAIPIAESLLLMAVLFDRSYLIGREWYWNWLDLLVVIPAWFLGWPAVEIGGLSPGTLRVLVCSNG